VSDAELLRAHGLFVAEGRLVVRRVLEDARYRVRSVLVNEAALRDLDVSLRERSSLPVFVCPTNAFTAITGYAIHRGCLALVERPPSASIADVLATGDRVVALEQVGNADNVGGVFRSAAAFGAAVLLSPASCDPFYRKAVRTSMGAALRVPFAWADEWPGALDVARAAGFTVVALTPREPSTSLDALVARAPRRVLLVVGGEGAGVSREVEAAADCRVRIPMTGVVDSLNLSVAAGIALYALRT
jgi:tRNA G18 (ribose-2'-O)-methylase SpoU